MTLETIVQIGQIISLIVVPIWVIAKINAANAVLAERMDAMSRVQESTTSRLEVLAAVVSSHTQDIAIQKGIRIGMEEAEKRRVIP